MPNGDGPTVEDIKFKSLNDSVSHMDGRINNIYNELADQKAWRMEIGSDVASMKTMLSGFAENQRQNAPSKTTWIGAVGAAIMLLGAVNLFVQQELNAIKEVESLKNSALLREVDFLREYNSMLVTKADEHELISNARGVDIGRLSYAVSELKENLNHLDNQHHVTEGRVNTLSERTSAESALSKDMRDYLQSFEDRMHREGR